MADNISPATDCYPREQWTLAGANSHGIVYGVSMDERILQMKLWSYNHFRRSWKVLSVADLPPLHQRIGVSISAIYDERLERVAIFVGCKKSSYILRFITAPDPKFDCIFSTTNDGNVDFDWFTGPSLHYCCGRLIITGSKHGDGWNVFRLFQAVINREERTFQLVQGCSSDCYDNCSISHVVAFGNRLLVVFAGGIWNVFCFTPDTREGTLRWPDPTLCRCYLNFDFFVLAPSLNSPDSIWIVPQSNPGIDGQICNIQEATVTHDGGLNIRRILECQSPDEEGVISTKAARKSAAASTSHIFWMQGDDNLEITSKAFSVPALEYLCLSKLHSTMEEFGSCELENDAVLMGLPVTTWRRFCQWIRR